MVAPAIDRLSAVTIGLYRDVPTKGRQKRDGKRFELPWSIRDIGLLRHAGVDPRALRSVLCAGDRELASGSHVFISPL